MSSLPSTGTYTAWVQSWNGVPASLSVTLNPAPEIAIDGAPVSISSTATGYGTSLTFQGTAGQNLGLSLSGLSFAGGGGGQVALSVYGPDRTQSQQITCYVSNPGASCNLALPNLSLTGTYFIWVNNLWGCPAIVGGNLTLSSDQTGTLTAGTASTLNLRSGQTGRLTFTGTAGTHTLTVGTPTTVPSGQALSITVLNASGSTVASGSYSAAATLSLGTLTDGATYTVVVVPAYGAATTVNLTYQ